MNLERETCNFSWPGCKLGNIGLLSNQSRSLIQDYLIQEPIIL